IRDKLVTGVQTCALPIFASVIAHEYPGPLTQLFAYGMAGGVSAARWGGQKHFASDVLLAVPLAGTWGIRFSVPIPTTAMPKLPEIGRASCRETGLSTGCG